MILEKPEALLLPNPKSKPKPCATTLTLNKTNITRNITFFLNTLNSPLFILLKIYINILVTFITREDKE